jgi:hypothetical protein
MKIQRNELISGLRVKGLVEMGPDGQWRPTHEGQRIVAEARLLEQLVGSDDDNPRPGPVRD